MTDIMIMKLLGIILLVV